MEKNVGTILAGVPCRFSKQITDSPLVTKIIETRDNLAYCMAIAGKWCRAVERRSIPWKQHWPEMFQSTMAVEL